MEGCVASVTLTVRGTFISFRKDDDFLAFQRALHPLLGEWPVARPKGWLARVNLPADEQQGTMIRDAIRRNRPVGSEAWVERTARALGLEQSLRPRDRPVGWRKRTGPSGKGI